MPNQIGINPQPQRQRRKKFLRRELRPIPERQTNPTYRHRDEQRNVNVEAIACRIRAGVPRHGMNNDASKPSVAIDSEPSRSCAGRKDVDTNESRQAFGRHFLSKQELALAVGVSPRTIDNWMAQKRIPFLRLSRRLIKFNLEQVKAALARYEIKEIGAPR